MLITQNLLHQTNYCRDISLNVKYLVLLENVSDNQQFMCLSRQVHTEGPNQLYKEYLKATKRPHGYFVLDLEQDTDDRLRFRPTYSPKDILLHFM
jgi:hypothetical protein